jgi:hypothetical protein
MNAAAKRFEELCAEAGKQLGVDANSEQAKLVATLRGCLEQQQVKLVAGHVLDPGLIVRLTELIAAQLPPPKPLRVAIQYVEGIVGICPKCKAEIGNYVAPKPTAPPPVIEGTAAEVKPSQPPTGDAPNSAAAAKAPPEVTPKPVEKPHPKWVGEGDRAYMPVQNILAGAEGWGKHSAWSGSAPMFGPHGGGVKPNGLAPGQHGYIDRSLSVTPAGEYGK